MPDSSLLNKPLLKIKGNFEPDIINYVERGDGFFEYYYASNPKKPYKCRTNNVEIWDNVALPNNHLYYVLNALGSEEEVISPDSLNAYSDGNRTVYVLRRIGRNPEMCQVRTYKPYEPSQLPYIIYYNTTTGRGYIHSDNIEKIFKEPNSALFRILFKSKTTLYKYYDCTLFLPIRKRLFSSDTIVCRIHTDGKEYEIKGTNEIQEFSNGEATIYYYKTVRNERTYENFEEKLIEYKRWILSSDFVISYDNYKGYWPSEKIERMYYPVFDDGKKIWISFKNKPEENLPFDKENITVYRNVEVQRESLLIKKAEDININPNIDYFKAYREFPKGRHIYFVKCKDGKSFYTKPGEYSCYSQVKVIDQPSILVTKNEPTRSHYKYQKIILYSSLSSKLPNLIYTDKGEGNWETYNYKDWEICSYVTSYDCTEGKHIVCDKYKKIIHDAKIISKYKSDSLGFFYLLYNTNEEFPKLYTEQTISLLSDPKELEKPLYIINSAVENVLFGIRKIIRYVNVLTQKFFCRISFENSESEEKDRIYGKNDLTFIQEESNPQCKDVLTYLEEMAAQSTITINGKRSAQEGEDESDEDSVEIMVDDNGEQIQDSQKKTISLADKYKKLKVIKKSLLSLYLSPNRPPEKFNCCFVIYPFGCNGSQQKAVKAALTNQISIVQGPPGTGKTQTILNIIANLVINKKTMEVVSNNNSAVKNVKDKLEKEGFGFLVAQLGKRDNKEAFIASQTGSYPDMSSWQQTVNKLKELKNSIIEESTTLESLFEVNVRLHRKTIEKEECRIQKERFDSRHPNVHVRKRTKRRFNTSQKVSEEKIKLSIPAKGLIRRFLRRIHRYIIGIYPNENANVVLDHLFYHLSYEEIMCIIEDDKQTLVNERFEDISLNLKEHSMLYFRAMLYERFGKKEERPIFESKAIWCKSIGFIREYPIVLSTTFSAVSNINPAVQFDYLIMDESSQVDVSAGALALSVAKNAVIVGDEKQLPNVVTKKLKENAEEIIKKYNINPAYNFVENSFLSSVKRIFNSNEQKIIPDTELLEHYRCHPLIIEFCNKKFYNQRLVVMTSGNFDDDAVEVITTVEGNHARGRVNERQADEISKNLSNWMENLSIASETPEEVGIISPYRDQVNLIHEKINNVDCDTVHKFQGQDRSFIIFSSVDNVIKEFADDPHLLNVAVSRAKKKFTLLVSANEQPESNIKDLIDYIKYYKGDVTKGTVTSVFDYLYSQYTNARLEYLSKYEQISDELSENLYYSVIVNVLNNLSFANILSVQCHYPLSEIVDGNADFTSKERRYFNNEWTHVDFLITSTCSHKPILAIEVDGIAFHKEDSKQAERDRLKNSILEKSKIPLLRVKTTESNLDERLSTRLKGLI